jgi:hypothetical protein
MSSEPPGQVPPPPPPGGQPPYQPPPGGQPPYQPPPQPGYPQPYGAPAGLPDAPNATIAMVLGIVALIITPIGCCCGLIEIIPIILGIVAVVLGIGARNRVNASGGTLGGGGKATAGIITGGIAVVLGVVFGVLYAVLYGLGSSGALNNLINQISTTPTP